MALGEEYFTSGKYEWAADKGRHSLMSCKSALDCFLVSVKEVE